MSFAHRSSLAKFRCGVAPLRIETGRYEKLPVHERKCPFCKTVVESELHALLNCPMYTFDRQVLLTKLFLLKGLVYGMSEILIPC